MSHIDFLLDGVSRIELKDNDSCDDVKVVNAARVSFQNYKDVFDPVRDAKLIQYLASHGHWTPFAHCREIFEVNDIFSLLSLTEISELSRYGVRMRRVLNRYQISVSLAHIPRLLKTPLRRIACRLFLDCGVSRQAFGVPESIITLGLTEFEKASHAGFVEKLGQNINRPEPHQNVRIIPGPSAHNVWPEETPVTVHVKCPIFLRSQIFKSNVGIVYNEVSRRYVNTRPQMYVPADWRARPEGSIKQGSGLILNTSPEIRELCNSVSHNSIEKYEGFLNMNVAPEMARMILPQNMYTEFWMTGSLDSMVRVVKLRNDGPAQKEAQQFGSALDRLLTDHLGDVYENVRDAYRHPHCFN